MPRAHSSAIPRRALVVQGGGMRGAYAAGAIIQLYEKEDRPFDAVWATSSGAASAAYALADQPEGLEIWRQHLHGGRLLHLGRGLRGGPLLDLDYLIDEVFRRRVPLDVAALRRSNVPLHVPLTDIEDGTVQYKDLTKNDPFPLLRAAMSLPGAVKEGVPIDGRLYVDGGVVDQLPLGRAVAAGARQIVCVMTRPASFRAQPAGRLSIHLATRRFPGIRSVLQQRHILYQNEMDLLDRPPPGVRIHVIRPSPRLKIRRWSRRQKRLLEAIEAGRRDTHTILASARESA